MGDYLTSLKVKNTYSVNSFIYHLKTLPILRNILPNKLYSLPWLKPLVLVFVMLSRLAMVFLWKFIYILVLGIFVLSMQSEDTTVFANIFLSFFFCFAVFGCFTNNAILDANKDKYYCIELLRMKARALTLYSYGVFIIKTFVGFFPFTLLFCFIYNVDMLIGLTMAFYVPLVKIAVAGFRMAVGIKSNKVNNPSLWLIGVAFLIAPFFLFFISFNIPSSVWYIVTLVTFILAVISSIYLVKGINYKTLYKRLFNENEAVLNGTAKSAVSQQAKTNYAKKIEISEETSNKNGFAMLHDLFIKRHKKLLVKPVKIAAIIEFGLFVALVILVILNKEAAELIKEGIFVFLSFFLLVMYYANRGQYIMKTMFYNCDYSLLTYKFYKEPKAILSLFTQRLKFVVGLDLSHSVIVALGLPILLFISGGTENNIDYLLIFISIIAMSVFFSVHSMVLYYVLQPYNKDMEMKSPAYGIISFVTYFVCYYTATNVSSSLIAVVSPIFCVLYITIALIIAYKAAPKTFKLR